MKQNNYLITSHHELSNAIMLFGKNTLVQSNNAKEDVFIRNDKIRLSLQCKNIVNSAYDILKDDICAEDKVYFCKLLYLICNDIKNAYSLWDKLTLRSYYGEKAEEMISRVNSIDSEVFDIRIGKGSDLTYEDEQYINALNQECKSILDVDVKSKLTKNEILNVINGICSFSRDQIVLYLILFDYFVKHYNELDNGYLVIDLKQIHSFYRGKTLNKFGYIDEQTLKSYTRAFKQLICKELTINTMGNKIKNYGEGKICPILKGSLIENDKGLCTGLKFSLGELGEMLYSSKQFSGMFPTNLLHKSYNEILYVEIALYLCRINFMRKKGKQIRTNGKYTISIISILKNIMFFGGNGLITGLTYYDRLFDLSNSNEKNHSNNKSRAVKKFNVVLFEVLEELVKTKAIKSFEYPNINVKNILDKETLVEIYV